jgi:hypothetical protein
MEENQDEVLFHEIQALTQKWIWLTLICAHLGMAYAVLQFKDGALFGVLLISWIFLGLTTLFMRLLRLEVKVNSKGIQVQFFPFHWSPIFFPWSDVQEAWAGKYAPLGEFGGWGWRYNFSGHAIAWSLSGNQCSKLVLRNGKKRLMGTRNPEGWKEVLRANGKGTKDEKPPF